jgi:hypothetical protein
MKIYNMMTCNNLGTDVLSGCGMAWLGLVILFFIGALLRKWGGEEMDIPFNFITCIIVSFLAYMIVMAFTGSTKFSMLAGIIALLVGGYGTPYIFEEPPLFSGS